MNSNKTNIPETGRNGLPETPIDIASDEFGFGFVRGIATVDAVVLRAMMAVLGGVIDAAAIASESWSNIS